MRPEKFPLGSNTAKKFLEFTQLYRRRRIPTAADMSERARLKHGKLCKDMWADPEFREKQMRVRATREAKEKASEAAIKSWKTRKGE